MPDQPDPHPAGEADPAPAGGPGEVRVVLNQHRHRYEVWAGDELAGFVVYRPRTGVLDLIHTEVEPPFEGHGLGSVLIRGALDDVRARDLHMVPTCPFVASFVRDHPDYADLVAG